ncbi:lipid A biosynthesis lauroyl acyltransferase [Aureimonas flava]|uniref:Lipid A biosynthesis lauroyl acyltransferase n=1 Tax=Aureimonas flava TaxID=2320271 RepID=A0A3A1WNW1_9HYPH|nr:lipid A biosynthesis lauroyl acyltransferase [Aureimonas flava]RIY01836.1 lipid A biosynthesis lauroyl acyltransferase [Aureimonas flava]
MSGRVLEKAWKRQRQARDWLIAQTLFGLLAVLRRFPARRGLALADGLAQRIGPMTARHRVAVENLTLAFPEMDAAAIEDLARRNWGQMGRIAAEYVFLDEIFDFDPSRDTTEGMVEVEGIELFLELRDNPKPIIFFTAHLGSFELLPICAATFGLELTALFRQPNNRYIAREVLSARRTRGGHLVPSKAGAAWALAGALEAGGNVGMLVDQKFKRGEPTTFFGRACRTNPLLPKLARKFDCDIHPARCVRLPGGRYRLTLEPRLELPRSADGGIDVQASCQRLNDVVERWVREHPEQWMWFHRRWMI